MGSKNFFFGDNREISNCEILIVKLWNRPILAFLSSPEIDKNRKEIKWLLMDTQSWIWKSNCFLFFSHPLSVRLKMGPKSKNRVRECKKNDTKDGIMGVWNELRLKFFYLQLLLNNTLLKMWSLDLWPWAHFCPPKNQNRATIENRESLWF